MCTQIIKLITHHSPFLQILGFTFLRISFGTIFLIFGSKKLISGPAYLTQIGSAISLFGITHGYLLWGCAAALTEFCGGLSYILGLGIRVSSLPLMLLLIVALRFHLKKGDMFSTWGFAALCLCIVVSFFIAGSGTYSVDHLMHCCMNSQQ
ncbi:MAG TPA: DoxX family protein [Candidatus Babeliales bacterium]|nr:DoxX family protein [Candidatus Babeliales bacterium]